MWMLKALQNLSDWELTDFQEILSLTLSNLAYSFYCQELYTEAGAIFKSL